MAALSAKIRGASKIFVVDKVQSRLKLAGDLGAIPIDFTATDPIEAVKEQTDGGADTGIDAVGYQAQAGEGKDETPAVVLNQLVHAVRATGRLGVVGLYVPSDPGAPNEDAAEGKLLFEIGTFFEKGQTMGTGQADVKSYNRQLRDLIIAGKAEPGFIVSKEIPLDEAPDAYQKFDDREDGYSKVLLHP